MCRIPEPRLSYFVLVELNTDIFMIDLTFNECLHLLTRHCVK